MVVVALLLEGMIIRVVVVVRVGAVAIIIAATFNYCSKDATTVTRTITISCSSDATTAKLISNPDSTLGPCKLELTRPKLKNTPLL